MLTQARLKELLRYDPDTGAFVWLATNPPRRGVRVGHEAGALNPLGYRIIRVDGKQHHGHRLAWLYVHGAFPSQYLDHVDGNPSNNAIGNLREASNRENQQNQAKHRAGKLPGVTFNSVGLRRPYQARMLVDGRSRSLGMYATPEEAHAAYLKGCAALLD